MDGCGVAQGCLGEALGSRVWRARVSIVEEGGINSVKGIRDERDGADAGKNGKLGAGRRSLSLRGHCWRMMLRRTRRVCGKVERKRLEL